LLGFGFMHVLPDTIADYEASYADKVTVNGGAYPIPYGLALVGFFLMILVERLLISKMKSLKDVPNKVPDSFTQEAESLPTSPQSMDIMLEDLEPRDEEGQRAHSHGHGHGDHGGFHSHDVPLNTRNPYAPYVLTFGLSFHSIFEGITLGLQTQVTPMILLIIAIGLHKVGEAFALGMSFMRYRVSTRRWILMVVVFCLVVPIGIAIGLGVTASGLDDYTQSTVSSILNSLAVGVFMYVSILGVIVEEFSNAEGKHLYFKIMIALGIAALMGCLTFLGA